MQLEAIPVGENSLILRVTGKSTADCVQQVDRVLNVVKTLRLRGLVGVRPGLDCLMLEFEGDYDSNRIVDALSLSAGTINRAPAGEPLEIPVCYEQPFARDLENVAGALGLKPQKIIDLHTERIYDVWMIGFMPGYPYMGSLNEKLQLPRKSTPDLSVPAGSVAIAEEFVGVYPFDSPGGWHIIGRTPLRLVDYSRSVPFLFQYGMKVKFHPVTTEGFRRFK